VLERRTKNSNGVRLASVSADTRPYWRGINHLALVTHDMDATVRFYHGVLGMRLVATVQAGPMRHYFFEIGPGNTVAFFEVSGAPEFELPAGVPDPRKAQFDHLSFNLPDIEALQDLQRRLKESGSEVTDIVDHGFIKSVYFTDPHGLALEASCWLLDATGRAADYGDDRVFLDPDPVPAVRELAATGTLDHVVTTKLAGD
jgi:catechol 2,3-dioxygenase-like lactoylglutathione lyase family enzyme